MGRDLRTLFPLSIPRAGKRRSEGSKLAAVPHALGPPADC